MSGGIRPPRQDFEAVVVSLRRWILGLGLLVLVGLLGTGWGRPVLLGFTVGWALSLFSLDHLAYSARRVKQSGMSGPEARVAAVRTYSFRLLVTVGVIAVAVRLGADPVAAISALLLLQAAIVAWCIVGLLSRGGEDPGESDEDPPGGLES